MIKVSRESLGPLFRLLVAWLNCGAVLAIDMALLPELLDMALLMELSRSETNSTESSEELLYCFISGCVSAIYVLGYPEILPGTVPTIVESVTRIWQSACC